MLKKISIRKITLSTIALLAISLLYLLPESKKINPKEELEYTNANITTSPIYLLDKNNYLAKVDVVTSKTNAKEKAQELIKIMTIDAMESKIPNGFNAILPPNTEVLNISIEGDLLKIDFSKDILDIDEKKEEKMVEAICYTLTEIENINKIIIYVEGDILTKLPKTKINLPSTLDKTFGINKEFDLTSTKDIKDVTIYYINQIKGNYYYVPVTKYLNDNREKIDIIIDELSQNFNPNKNLMSFLSANAKLVSAKQNGQTLNLEFNEELFDDKVTETVLDEVIQSVSLSAKENYDINEVVFTVNSKEVAKKAL